MTTPSAEARRARAAVEAAEWLQRLDSGHMSTSERGDFVDWLRESPVHVAETLRINRLASALAEFPDWSEVAGSTPVPSDKVVSLPPSQATRHARRFRVSRLAGIAAVVAGLALLGGSAFWIQRHLAITEIRTHLGERREITLDDGSVVRLSPNTHLQVELQPKLRSVSLERGEAVFRVAKDPARPFVVDAARAHVRAVGTVFAVARNEDNVVVTVTEGRVTVAPSVTSDRGNAPGRAVIVLQANERVSISPVGTPSEVRRVAMPPTPAWDEDQLVFVNTRVAEVVSRFNQRNRVQIRITDPALSSRTVSGVFHVDDPRSFVDFLTVVAGASSTQNGSDEISVTPRASGADSIAPAR